MALVEARAGHLTLWLRALSCLALPGALWLGAYAVAAAGTATRGASWRSAKSSALWAIAVGARHDRGWANDCALGLGALLGTLVLRLHAKSLTLWRQADRLAHLIALAVATSIAALGTANRVAWQMVFRLAAWDVWWHLRHTPLILCKPHGVEGWLLVLAFLCSLQERFSLGMWPRKKALRRCSGDHCESGEEGNFRKETHRVSRASLTQLGETNTGPPHAQRTRFLCR